MGRDATIENWLESMSKSKFQKLVKNAPNFVSMERGELVTYAYSMYAVAVKTEAENAELRKLILDTANELRKDALIQGAHARYDVANLFANAARKIDKGLQNLRIEVEHG